MCAGRGVQYVQKKKTIYPEWNTCFDAHLYDGRMIHMVVMQRPQKLVADVNIGAKNLAEKCPDGEVASVWVGYHCIALYTTAHLHYGCGTWQCQCHHCLVTIS